MTSAADMSPRFWARAVGVLYLLMAAIGSIPSLVGHVRISNDAAATAAAILAHPSQVYTGFAASLLVVVCYLPVPVLFYKLFKPVNHTLSLTAAFAGLTGCAVQAFACLFRIAPLIVLIGCLVFKSTFLPRFLGVLAVIAGVGWMAFLWPPLADRLWPRVILPLDV